jgi:50S ribosomal subunit-associated GTPase HflX
MIKSARRTKCSKRSAFSKKTLLVINKVDAMPDRMRLDGILSRYPNAVPLSARTGFGLPNLVAVVSEALSRSFLDVDVEIGVDNGRLLAYLAANGEVLSKHFQENRVIVHCRLPKRRSAFARIIKEKQNTTSRNRRSRNQESKVGSWNET